MITVEQAKALQSEFIQQQIKLGAQERKSMVDSITDAHLEEFLRHVSTKIENTAKRGDDLASFTIALEPQSDLKNPGWNLVNLVSPQSSPSDLQRKILIEDWEQARQYLGGENLPEFCDNLVIKVLSYLQEHLEAAGFSHLISDKVTHFKLQVAWED